MEGVELDVRALCVDTTCCSVVALSKQYQPLRPSLLWMDARSSDEADAILELCRGDPALEVNSGGKGPLSAEWMLPKAMWLKRNEPDVWEATATLCEYQDYLNYRLTGRMCASSCNAAVRWHWDGEECLVEPEELNDDNNDDDDDNDNDAQLEFLQRQYPGRPVSLYQRAGMKDLLHKQPRRCLAMGRPLGKLTPSMAEALGLSVNVTVAQGGPDAFVGMVGLGCIRPGQMCLITGSSHLHCLVRDKPIRGPGIWGAYRGAPLPGLCFAEGGQSSTGSILRWARSNLFGGSSDDNLPSYRQLDDEAARIAPGSDGLVALETFQGARTPVTDPRARGALMGLTLSHTRAHVWRALMEAVCLGTRAAMEGFSMSENNINHLISPLQMTIDDLETTFGGDISFLKSGRLSKVSPDFLSKI